MVLVDTSVWIDFLRKAHLPESKILSRLIESENDIAICGLIRQEVLQGIREDLNLNRIRSLLDQAFYLSLEEPQTFDEAADIYRTLRRKGVTLRSPMDCLIAAVAIRFNTPVLYHDRDFLSIARFTDLILYPV